MNAMAPIVERIQRAEQLWRQGDLSLAAGNRERAYRLYTEAHDAIVDCPKHHATAHRHLRKVTRHHRNKTEFVTDSVLVWLAPLGVFELIAVAMRSKVRGDALCRRGA